MRILKQVTLLLSMALVASCSLECESTDDIQVTFLVDISDERLLEATKRDMHNNLGTFMKKLGLATLDECQRLTVNIAPLSARDELRLESAHLSMTDRGLSAQDRRKRANPKPVIDMIHHALESYDSLKDVPDYQRGSSIGNQILKAINQTRHSNQSYVVVFSDMVQHDEYLSFYQHIPRSIDSDNIKMLFDPLMLQDWQGSDGVKVIIVHLQQVDTSMKGRRREIAALWSEAFQDGLGVEVAVKDNLTH